MVPDAKRASSKPVEAPVKAAPDSEFDFSDDPDPSAPSAEVQPITDTAAADITAEELALAMQAETPSASGSDDCEWEDVLEISPDTALRAMTDKSVPQATRRDVWTRTHGYKFGRKLADWSDTTEAPAAVNAADAAAMETVVATAEEGDASHSVQEARKLQLAILQSFDGRAHPEAEKRPPDSAPEQKEVPVENSQGRKRVRFAMGEAEEHNLQGNRKHAEHDQVTAINDPEVDRVNTENTDNVEPDGVSISTEPVRNDSLPHPEQEATSAQPSIAVQDSAAMAADIPSSEPTHQRLECTRGSSEEAVGAVEAGVTDARGIEPNKDRQTTGPCIKLPSWKAMKLSQLPSVAKQIKSAASAGDNEVRIVKQAVISVEPGQSERHQAGAGVDVRDLEWEEADEAGPAASSAPHTLTPEVSEEPAQKRQAVLRQPQQNQEQVARAVPALQSGSDRPVPLPVRGDRSSAPAQHDTLHGVDVDSSAQNSQPSEPEGGQSIIHKTADDGQVGSLAPEPTLVGIPSSMGTESLAENAAHQQEPDGSVDIDVAHAAAMELEQAEEELVQVEDDAVVHLTETPQPAGGAEDAVAAGGGAAVSVAENMPQASTDNGKGSLRQADVQEPPASQAEEDHINNAVGMSC